MDDSTAYLSAVIQFSEVRKRFGRRGVEALRGVNLTVAAGERLAVAGPNGAGKSTLLALALGFLHPTSGAVKVDGVDPRAWLRRNGAGWVPERFRLPPGLKVRPAAEHFARLDGGRSSSARAAAALEHFGLDAHAGQPVTDLSHGFARRLALAIATITPRRLVVLDEPTEGLDADGRRRFESRCEWLSSLGSTLVVASQDASTLGRIADRVVRLDRGAVVDDTTAPQGPVGLACQIVLERPFDRFAEFFPTATAWPGENVFRVSAADAADFSARLRSLLDAGAVIVSAGPVGPVAPSYRDTSMAGDPGAGA